MMHFCTISDMIYIVWHDEWLLFTVGSHTCFAITTRKAVILTGNEVSDDGKSINQSR